MGLFSLFRSGSHPLSLFARFALASGQVVYCSIFTLGKYTSACCPLSLRFPSPVVGMVGFRAICPIMDSSGLCAHQTSRYVCTFCCKVHQVHNIQAMLRLVATMADFSGCTITSLSFPSSIYIPWRGPPTPQLSSRVSNHVLGWGVFIGKNIR